MSPRLLISFLLLAHSSSGLCEEHRSNKEEPVLLTVCEVLEQRHQYNDKVVVLVGVKASTDEGGWLLDNGCIKRVITQGFAWSNDISLKWAPTLAPEPLGLALMAQTEFGTKLQLVQQRNSLRQFRHGKLDFSDRWVVAYGRFQSRPDLKPPKGKGVRQEWGNGYGHLNGSPAQLLIKEGSIRYIKDDAATSIGSSMPKPNPPVPADR